MDVRNFALDKTPEDSLEFTPTVPTDPEAFKAPAAAKSTGAEADGVEEDTDYLSVHRKAVADAKIPKELLFSILDGIITNEYADLSTEILGKIPIVFRTRPAWVQTYLVNKIQTEDISSVMRYRDTVSKVNLAGSIVRYRNQNMLAKSIEDLERNLDWVEKLPQPVLVAAAGKLALFDSMVILATSDEVVENFTQPPSAA